MRITRPKPLSRDLLGLLFAAALCVLAYSCRKDHTGNGELPSAGAITAHDAGLVAGARAWYQTNGPVPVSAAAGAKLQALSTPVQVDNWTRSLVPLWDSAYTSVRDSFKVVEAPIGNGTLYFLKNQTSAGLDAAITGKNYTKAEYVFTKDGQGLYRAYLMVLMADADYADNTASHFERNNYRHREPGYSGRLLYYNLQGKLLTGYRYKDGQINGSISPVAAESTLPAKKVEALKPLLRDGSCH